MQTYTIKKKEINIKNPNTFLVEDEIAPEHVRFVVEDATSIENVGELEFFLQYVNKLGEHGIEILTSAYTTPELTLDWYPSKEFTKESGKTEIQIFGIVGAYEHTPDETFQEDAIYYVLNDEVYTKITQTTGDSVSDYETEHDTLVYEYFVNTRWSTIKTTVNLPENIKGVDFDYYDSEKFEQIFQAILNSESNAKTYAERAEAAQSAAEGYADDADDARIESITETTSSEDGGINTIIITYKDGTTKKFTVKNGSKGSEGVGVPVGGTEGQVLLKNSNSDYDVKWGDAGSSNLKADKVVGATSGDVAMLDSTGNLQDSGLSAANISIISETGYKVNLEIDSLTYVVTPKLYDKSNNLISTGTGIDLPLETMVVGASYDSVNKTIILTLKNGQTISFSVADLVSGLVSETTFNAHANNTSNPHSVTKEQVGLGNVDNTSDLDKPVSTATQTELAKKVDKTNSASKVYGTDAQGEQTTYDVNSFGQVDDVRVDGVSVVSNKIASLGSMAGADADDYYTKTEVDTALNDYYTKTEADDLFDEKQDSIGSTSVTIAVSDWSNKTCTKNVTGVTVSNTVVVSPAPSSIDDYGTFAVKCTAQGAGTLKFECDDTPDSAIVVNVLII